jgi:hypothetical protein
MMLGVAEYQMQTCIFMHEHSGKQLSLPPLGGRERGREGKRELEYVTVVDNYKILVVDYVNNGSRMILDVGSSLPGNDADRYLVTTLSPIPEKFQPFKLALDQRGRLFVLEKNNVGLVREMLVPARKGSVAANQTLVVCILCHLCLYGCAWLQQ